VALALLRAAGARSGTEIKRPEHKRDDAEGGCSLCRIGRQGREETTENWTLAYNFLVSRPQALAVPYAHNSGRKGGGVVDTRENDPAFWRAKATEARAMADYLTNDRARQCMLNCAASYERIAQMAERGILPRAAERQFRSRMPPPKKPQRKAKSGFPDRQIVAKAEGRFAKADKQHASIKADPKKAVSRARARVRSFNR